MPTTKNFVPKVLAIFSALGLLMVVTSSLAAVNLDRPFLTGRADRVYGAKDNPAWAYTIPTYLVRLSDYSVNKLDDRFVVRFAVGADPDALADVRAAIAASGVTGVEPRYFRATFAELVKDSTSIEDKFEHKLQAVTELNQIGGPIEMVLSLKSKPKLIGKNGAKKAIASLFGSCNDHLGTLVYEFNSWLKDAPHIARTSIGVFSGPQDRASCHQSPSAKPKGPSHIATVWPTVPLPSLDITGLFELQSAPSMQIAFDSEANCWEKPAPNQICLRPQ